MSEYTINYTVKGREDLSAAYKEVINTAAGKKVLAHLARCTQASSNIPTCTGALLERTVGIHTVWQEIWGALDTETKVQIIRNDYYKKERSNEGRS